MIATSAMRILRLLIQLIAKLLRICVHSMLRELWRHVNIVKGESQFQLNSNIPSVKCSVHVQCALCSDSSVKCLFVSLTNCPNSSQLELSKPSNARTERLRNIASCQSDHQN
uniref:Secreted protein n=1 Tax=Mucochytrium quahogii TaxID=96639 RepID=A0A7S2WLA9_9STRA